MKSEALSFAQSLASPDAKYLAAFAAGELTLGCQTES